MSILRSILAVFELFPAFSWWLALVFLFKSRFKKIEFP